MNVLRPDGTEEFAPDDWEDEHPMPTWHGIGTRIQWKETGDTTTEAGGPVYRWPR